MAVVSGQRKCNTLQLHTKIALVCILKDDCNCMFYLNAVVQDSMTAFTML